VPAAERRRWGELLEGYFQQRQTLAGLMLIMDVRHPLTDYDRQLLQFAVPLGRPVHVLLSKADKLGKNAARQSLAEVKRWLCSAGSVQLLSSHTGEGVDEARTVLAGWLGLV
jgi:GTP-binding protein